MKKLILVFLIFLFVGIGQAFCTGTVKVGYVFGGSYEQTSFGVDVSSTNLSNNVCFATELFFPLFKFLDLGAGVEYQSPREVKVEIPWLAETQTRKIQFIPLYGIARINLSFAPQFAGFLFFRAGYSFFTGNNDFAWIGIYRTELKGKGSWGAGFGFIAWENVLFELAFSKHKAELITPSTVIGLEIDSDVQYSSFSASAGFNF